MNRHAFHRRAEIACARAMDANPYGTAWDTCARASVDATAAPELYVALECLLASHTGIADAGEPAVVAAKAALAQARGEPA